MKNLVLYVKYICPQCNFQKIKEFNKDYFLKKEKCCKHSIPSIMKSTVHCEMEIQHDLLL